MNVCIYICNVYIALYTQVYSYTYVCLIKPDTPAYIQDMEKMKNLEFDAFIYLISIAWFVKYLSCDWTIFC